MIVEIFIATIIISFISTLGFFILDFKYARLFISFAAGVMLSVAFLDLLPESVSLRGEEAFPLALSGILLFFLVESFLGWHHHKKASGLLVLVGDALHNFVDGIAIAAAFFVSPELGFSTALAVALHEIPQELGDFSILINSGYSKNKALLLNLVSGFTAVIGALLFVLGGSYVEGTSPYVLALISGMFIYISATDLLPELLQKKKVENIIIMLIGVAIGGLL